MRAIAYVDGFNLYYRALRGTPYKWLNVVKMLALEFPDDEIAQVRYFTARIKGRPNDPDKPARQEIYLRALRTLPTVCLQLGKYQSYEEEMHVVNPTKGCPDPVLVWNTEEKGSDVNLASWLLLDCFDKRMQKAIVVSNDSDLLTPLKTARNRFGVHVAVDSPDRVQPNLELKAVANTFKGFDQPPFVRASSPTN